MERSRIALLQVNIAVVLFGMAGLFAKWIGMPAIGITFGRVCCSSAALFVYLKLRRQRIAISLVRNRLLLAAGGAILALHWWAFLTSVKLATVAVGTITFSTFPLFVTFLEPLVFHRRLKLRDVCFALLLLAGAAVTVPQLSPDSRHLQGILVGMLSALAYAVLTVINKMLTGDCGGTVIAFWEQLTAAVVLLPFAAAAELHPTGTDILLTAVMGILMTAVSHTLFITSLQGIPARLAGISSALETVYGIIFALIILGEVPSAREVIGAVIIVGTAVMAQLTARE